MTEENAREASPYKLRLWHHVILCAALFACEVAVTYELIYMIVVEQIFGLPLYLVSLPGVISSSCGLFFVPIMGSFGDKGNRFRRKSVLVILSGLFQAGGAAILLAICVVKITSISNSNDDTGYNDIVNCTFVNTTKTHSCNDRENRSSCGRQVNALAVGTPDIHNASLENFVNCGANKEKHWADGSMVLPVLAMISFALMDIGFDTGSSNIRAFMLESVHPSGHPSVLSVGVLMSGFGGCVFALLGLQDYTKIFSHNVDENLPRCIVLSTFLILAVFITLPMTLLFGGFLRRNFELQQLEIELTHLKQDKTVCYTVASCKVDGTHGSVESFQHKATIWQNKLRLMPLKIRLIFKSKQNISLMLICLATFLGAGTSITFEVFFSNFLVDNVYHGDSQAPPGSTAKENFDRGMRTAATGTFIFEGVFFIYNLIHKQVSDRIGQVAEYVLICAITLLVLVALIISQNVNVFYALAVCNGAYRTVFFTTPFVLATEAVDEDSEKQHLLSDTTAEENVAEESTTLADNSSGSTNKSQGLTISMVYVMIPVCYLILSATMGPLLDATGNTGAPLMVGAIMGVGGALTLLAFAYIGRTWRS